jgi:hypothetical protein
MPPERRIRHERSVVGRKTFHDLPRLSGAAR